MRPLRFRLLALATLLAFLGACGGEGAPKGRTGDPEEMTRKASPKKPSRKGAGTPAALPRLSLEGLGEETVEGEEEGSRPARNLFAFEEDPAIAIERERQAKEAQEKAMAEQRLRDKWQGPPLPPPPPPPPQPPPIPFTFIGYLGPPQARIGVFSLPGGGGLVLARSGDRIQQKFVVKDVGFESAEIGFDGFTETKRIAMTPGS